MMKALKLFISFCKSFFPCVIAQNIVPLDTDPGPGSLEQYKVKNPYSYFKWFPGQISLI